MKKLAKERRKSLSPSLKKGRSAQNSRSELSPTTAAAKRSPNLSSMPTASSDNQISKPQKEHRKKKKHKKDSYGVAVLWYDVTGGSGIPHGLHLFLVTDVSPYASLNRSFHVYNSFSFCYSVYRQGVAMSVVTDPFICLRYLLIISSRYWMALRCSSVFNITRNQLYDNAFIYYKFIVLLQWPVNFICVGSWCSDNRFLRYYFYPQPSHICLEMIPSILPVHAIFCRVIGR